MAFSATDNPRALLWPVLGKKEREGVRMARGKRDELEWRKEVSLLFN